MIRSIILLLLLSNILYVVGQEETKDCKCCTEQHKQFDFLLGAWDVIDEEGNLLGSSTATNLLDRCVIQEKLESPKMTSLSYNYFDSKTLEWKQLWFDNQDGTLELSGSFQDGIILMKSRIRMISDGTDEVFDEVSWKMNADGTVTQRWLVRSVSGRVLEKVFTRIYRQK